MIILSNLYRFLIQTAERNLTPKTLKAIKWDHPAGPKTIHFWAPFAKWVLNIVLKIFFFLKAFSFFQGLVLAGIGDMARPANKLSKNQTISLLATGFIWSRYSLVIIPKNYSLFAVNFFVGCTGLVQFIRIYLYEESLKKEQEKQMALENKAN